MSFDGIVWSAHTPQIVWSSMPKNDTVFSPAAITFLLHCHTTPLPFERAGAPFYGELCARWLEEGVIKHDDEQDGVFLTTELGAAWVKALCNVKKPTSVYVDEHGVILK